jgi:shikimate kinase
MVGMGNLYLVGFMGSGKTAVGETLARSLGRPFLDLDAYLEERLGMSIAEVFEQRGEGAFRDAERAALEWTTSFDDRVIATGGGAFCSPVNRDLIHRAGRSVFLDVPWPVLAARLEGDHLGRPMYGGREAARRLYEARRPHYLQATWRVALDGSEPPEAAAERIRSAVAGAACAT